MKNIPLMMAMKARGLSVTKLAAEIGTTHSQVSLTLNNRPNRGKETRPKLAKLLTPDELALVGWDAEGKLKAESREQKSKQQVEQSST